MMSQTGRCLCGAVSFVAEEVKTNMHVCHCNMCLRWGGPAFAPSVGKVTFEGEEHIGRYDSSAWAERGFCQKCGSHLFYRIKKSGGYAMWMGSFDDRTPFSVVGEIFVDEKPECYHLQGEHPRKTGEEFMEWIKSSQGGE